MKKNNKIGSLDETIDNCIKTGKLPKGFTLSDFSTLIYCKQYLGKVGMATTINKKVSDYFVKVGYNSKANGCGYMITK